MIAINEKTALIDSLLEFYYKHDAFQSVYLPKEEVREIYEALIDEGRIHTCFSNGELVGYGESFRLSYEDFGKIICGWNIYPHLRTTDLQNGPIAYVANVTILPEYRSSEVMKVLVKQFFQRNLGAKHYCGRAYRKKHQPLKVFDFHESYLKWSKEA